MTYTAHTTSTLLAIWVSMAGVSTAQRTAEVAAFREVPIEVISTAEGLSQGMVSAVVEDREGFLWIATKDGLNRYDGTEFRVYRTNPDDPFSIADNFIRSLYMDSRGLLWVGTNTMGLDIFDPDTERFVHIGRYAKRHSGKELLSISRILEDASGNISISSFDDGTSEMFVPTPNANLYEPGSWQAMRIEELYPAVLQLPLPFNDRYLIGFTREGTMWYAEAGVLYAIRGSSKRKDEQLLTEVRPDPDPTTTRYFIDASHDNLYAAVKGSRILRFNFSARRFDPVLNIPDGYPLHDYRLVMDQRERLWGYSVAGSLIRVDLTTGLFVPMRCLWNVSGNAKPNYFRIECLDKSGNIWGRTNGYGLVKMSARNDQFMRVTSGSQFGTRFSSPESSSLCWKDSRFDVWKSKLLQQGNGMTFPQVPNFPNIDSSGAVWVSTVDEKARVQYLVKVDLALGQHQIIVQMEYDSSEWFSLPAFSYQEYIWLGERLAPQSPGLVRLFRVDLSTGKISTFPFPVNVIQNGHQFVSDWHITGDNKIWLATKQGLFSFAGPEHWEHFEYESQDPRSLSNNTVLTLCPDPREPSRYLWVGTDGGGLNKFDLRTKTFERFSSDDGLPNNVIYAVQSDKRDNLWMSTNLGICLFNPKTMEVRTFTTDDGLPGNEFNRFEYCKANDGTMSFGGIAGAVYFDPESFYQDTTPSPIVINKIKLLNEEVRYRGSRDHSPRSYQLPAPIERCQSLVFNYNDRMISLGFALLDLTNPGSNRYRYRMESFDKEWINARLLREATYTNLRPGDYTFKVAGRNSSGIWSTPATLKITILPPWWGTWWFRVLVLFVIASGIYAFYRYRLLQALKLQNLRNRIAADLHDEIGSTLSSISLAGTVIQKKLDGSSPEVESLMQRISNNTQSMMEAMSDIVWAVNTKNDRFDNVVHRMRAFAVEILEPKQIQFHFDINPQVQSVQLDMQQRKNLYLIFKEAINNAAKYAECTNVWVTIDFRNSRITLSIKDDGKGFKIDQAGNGVALTSNGEQQIRFGGNGLNNMEIRAAEIKGKLHVNSITGQGTVVGIDFPV